jgi:hypothetical protein
MSYCVRFKKRRARKRIENHEPTELARENVPDLVTYTHKVVKTPGSGAIRESGKQKKAFNIKNKNQN